VKKIFFLVVIFLVLVLGCAHVSENELKAVHYAKDQYGNCYFYLIDKTGQPNRLGPLVIDGETGGCPPVVEGRKFLSIELRTSLGAQDLTASGNLMDPLDCYVFYGPSSWVTTATSTKVWHLKKCPKLEKRSQCP